MDKQNQIAHLKKEILINIVKAFYTDDFEENIRKIPYVMRPKNADVPFRCCIYKERAVLKDRAIAGLGFSIEDDDETISLATYAKRALEREKPEENTLTVLQAACKGCVPSRVYVTDLCQGCVARPCVSSCKLGAISVVGGKSAIDPSKCKNCMLCTTTCPYGAIAKIRVPCEEICPVFAIKKDESGYARINFETCISCGKCIGSCPFGAIHEKSQIVDILVKIKEGKKVNALLAPSIAGQFPYKIGQIKCALQKIGFFDVLEVAYGADITTRHEGEDFKKRMEQGDNFMTTSCCTAYNELVKRHIPDMKPFVASSKTPLGYSAELSKNECPECITVFVSPCATKRKEGLIDSNINYVLNFNELEDLFVAMNIDVEQCEELEFAHESSKQGRHFPTKGGVAKAVSDYLRNTNSYDESDEDNIDCGMDNYVGGGFTTSPGKIMPKPYIINEITKQSIKDLKIFAQTKTCEFGNLIEIMSCPGGCLGGNATLYPVERAKKMVDEYSDESFEIEA